MYKISLLFLTITFWISALVFLVFAFINLINMNWLFLFFYLVGVLVSVALAKAIDILHAMVQETNYSGRYFTDELIKVKNDLEYLKSKNNKKE